MEPYTKIPFKLFQRRAFCATHSGTRFITNGHFMVAIERVRLPLLPKAAEFTISDSEIDGEKKSPKFRPELAEPKGPQVEVKATDFVARRAGVGDVRVLLCGDRVLQLNDHYYQALRDLQLRSDPNDWTKPVRAYSATRDGERLMGIVMPLRMDDEAQQEFKLVAKHVRRRAA